MTSRLPVWSAILVLVAGCGGGTITDAGPDPDPDPPPPPQPGFYLRGATVITGTGAAVRTGEAVVVRGERITAIEVERTVVPEELDIIDLDGLTLLPGFIDAHVHLSVDQDDYDRRLAALLDYGVTTVKDVGGELDVLLGLRDEVAAGRQGPRMVVAGPSFTAPGGHPVFTYGGAPDYIANAVRQVDDPNTARAEVRALATAGVDLIKCVLTDCRGNCPRLDPLVLDAIVDEAAELGLPVFVHTDSSDDVFDALAAGATGLEHGVTEQTPDPTVYQAIADAGVWVVPTLSVVATYGAGLSELVDRVSQYRSLGVPIAIGTDAENISPFGFSFHNEMRATLLSDYDAMEVLGLATRAGAEHVGLGDELGTIEAGKLADLVAVRGDPLTTMSDSEQVEWVFRSGEILRSP